MQEGESALTPLLENTSVAFSERVGGQIPLSGNATVVSPKTGMYWQHYFLLEVGGAARMFSARKMAIVGMGWVFQ